MTVIVGAGSGTRPEPATYPPLVPTSTRRVRLRSLEPPDLDMLYRIATAPGSAYLWRFRGATPSPDLFRSQLWDGVLSQHVAVDAETGRLFGLVAAYSADSVNQHCHVGAVCQPAFASSGAGAEALALFAGYLFGHWPFRKVYAEIPEFAIGAGVGARLFADGSDPHLHVEGRLVEHAYHAGRWWDVLLVALHRRDWPGLAQRCGMRGDPPRAGPYRWTAPRSGRARGSGRVRPTDP